MRLPLGLGFLIAIVVLGGCQSGSKTGEVVTPETLRGAIDEQLRPQVADAWTGRQVTLVALPELSANAENALLEPFGQIKGLTGKENAATRDELLRTLKAFTEQSLKTPGPGDPATDEAYADQIRHIVSSLVLTARLYAEEKKWKDAAESAVRAAEFTRTSLASCVTDVWQDVSLARLMALDGVKELAGWPGMPPENIAQLRAGTKPISIREVMANATKASFVEDQIARISDFQTSENQVKELAGIMARFSDPAEREAFLKEALTDAKNPFHAKKTVERAGEFTTQILAVMYEPWPTIAKVVSEREAVIRATWGKNPLETPVEKLDAADAQPRLVNAQNPVGELLAWEVTQNLRFQLEMAIVADAMEAAAQIALATRAGTKIKDIPTELMRDPLSQQPFLVDEKLRMLRSPLAIKDVGDVPGVFALGLTDPGVAY